MNKYPKIDDDDIYRVPIPLPISIIKKIVKKNKGGMALFWNLTDAGKQLMLHTRTVKTAKKNSFK